ncbi:hypothetical protein [Caballeronia sp. ATUFL_M1_KS5A]|uniref:hypothetical protein n=1 Tax=Caballeronia sp. ATUFL_M1_KS5A TaxID=2921778 RepID=UPI002029345B|nr:hypothetical protein [Caballeronia sp. ATUFL_M1_KS5A]
MSKVVALQSASDTFVPSRYESMCRAIAECDAIDEVKDLRDKAMALEVYARQAMNVEAERQAQRIRVRAERRAGELLKTTPKRTGGDAAKARSKQTTEFSPPPALADLGISKDKSAQWQQLADVPEPAFQAALEDEFEPITAARIIERQKPLPEPDLRAKINRMDSRALWLCGCVRDFERDKVNEVAPRELFDAMTDPMRAHIVRLAPSFIAYLSAMIEGAHHE